MMRRLLILIMLTGGVKSAGAERTAAASDAGIDITPMVLPPEPPQQPIADDADSGDTSAGENARRTHKHPIYDDLEVIAQTKAAVLSEQRYEEFKFRHAKTAFQNQNIQSWIVFIAVLLVFAFGIYTSWHYFRNEPKDVRIGGRARKRRPGDEQAVNEHTMKAGADGITVSTPAIGVIVLALSLGFFYLYLRHVYPIHNTTLTAPPVETQPQAKAVSSE